MIWFFAIVDVIGRRDLGWFTELVWLFGIIFVPLLGTFIYFLVRPAIPAVRENGPPVAGMLYQLITCTKRAIRLTQSTSRNAHAS